MNTNNRMTLWKEAFNPSTDFRREFDRLFDDWLAPATRGLRSESRSESHFVPACDVEEQEDYYLLTLEVAGVKKDDIRMEVIGNQIVISGERRNEIRKNEDGLTYSERRFGKFQRNFALPEGVDSSQVEANYQDGVLRVVFPKAESEKPRQIKITNGNGISKFFGKLINQAKENEDVHLTRDQKDRAAS